MVTPKTTLLAPEAPVPARTKAPTETSHTISLSTRAFELRYRWQRTGPVTDSHAQPPPEPVTVRARTFGAHEVRRRQQLARLLCPPITEQTSSNGPLPDPAPVSTPGPACRAYQQAAAPASTGTRFYKA